MTQSLHILRKDLQHQWRDLVLYVIVLILFAVVQPFAADGHWVGNPALPLLITLFKIVMPLCWLNITVRLVHDETLVGDRQFWITKPYRWQSLVAAKSIFLAVCIVMPFIAMQCIMAAREGLNPFNMGLVISISKTALFVWIPIFLVATVTTTLATAFFAVIGTVIVWAMALTSVISRDDPRTDAPYAVPVLGLIFATIFITVLIYQYKTRNTQRSRIALYSIVVLFLAVFIGYVQMSFPFLGDMLMHIRYRKDTALQLHLVYSPTPQRIDIDAPKSKSDGYAYANLPITMEGLGKENRLTNINASYTAEVEGRRYKSPWRPLALTYQGIALVVPRSFLRDASGRTVHLQLEITGTLLNPADTRTVTISDRFAVSDNGVCSAIDAPGNHFRCGFAYGVPDPIRIDPVTPPNCRAGTLQSASVRTEDAGTGVEPVRVEVLGFNGGPDCKVATARSIAYRPAENFRTSIDIPSLDLRSYVSDN